MLGMLGVIVQNNVLKNTVQISQVVTPGEKYLVRFLNPPAFSRVCGVEEIATWLLFATQEEANTFVAQSSGPQPGAQVPGKPSESPPPTPPAAKPNGNDSDPRDAKTEDEPALPSAEPVSPAAVKDLEMKLKKDLEPDISGGSDGPKPGNKS